MANGSPTELRLKDDLAKAESRYELVRRKGNEALAKAEAQIKGLRSESGPKANEKRAQLGAAVAVGAGVATIEAVKAFDPVMRLGDMGKYPIPELALAAMLVGCGMARVAGQESYLLYEAAGGALTAGYARMRYNPAPVKVSGDDVGADVIFDR